MFSLGRVTANHYVGTSNHTKENYGAFTRLEKPGLSPSLSGECYRLT
ncbi:hypothetical protein ACS127_17820 [Amphibacillus sp. Q70]